jgi:hypothetical protein
MWNWIDDFSAYVKGRYTFHDLIKPHNEHRIVTTRLILFADALWFHMTGRFVAVANLLLLAGIGYALACITCSAPRRALVRAIWILFPIAWMWSTCQWQNLILPFQVQFACLCLSIVASFACLIRASSRRKGLKAALCWGFLSGLFYFSACYSMAGGLLALPVLVILVILRRSDYRVALIILSLCSAAALSFLYNYHPAPAGPRVLGLDGHAIMSLALFASGFLGSAFYALQDAAFALGAVGIALYAACSCVVLRHLFRTDNPLPGRLLALFGVCTTLFLIAGAAAVSRAHFGASLALAPRYATISLLFWGSLLPLFVLTLEHLGWVTPFVRLQGSWLAIGPIAALLFCSVWPEYAGEAAGFDNLMQAQALSMRENVYVPELFAAMFYGTRDEARDRIVLMREQKLSVFAPGLDDLPPSQLMNSALTATTPLRPCQGHIDLGYRLDAHRFVLRAWLGSQKVGRSADWIILLGPSGRPAIILPALEYRGKLGSHPHKIRHATGVYGGFSAPGAFSERGLRFRMIGLFADSSRLACAYPSDLDFTPLRIQEVGSAQAARPQENFRVIEQDGGFSRDAATPGTSLPTPFSTSDVYATAKAGDSALGNITLQVRAAQRDVVLPFAVGPDASRQSLSVAYQDGTSDVLPIPMDSREGTWRLLAIPHDTLMGHGGDLVSITARDDGSRWGQWLAVAAPEAVTLDPDWAKLY